MPRRSEFTAAPDVREHKHPAALEPQFPIRAMEFLVGTGVRGRERILKATVGKHPRRCPAVAHQALRHDDKIGHPRAVRRGCPVLGDLKLGPVKRRRLRFQQPGQATVCPDQIQRRRRQKRLILHQRIAALVLRGFNRQRAMILKRNLRPTPRDRPFLSGGQAIEPTAHVLQRGHPNARRCRHHGFDHRARGRCDHEFDLADLASQRTRVRHHLGTARKPSAPARPRFLQPDHEPPAKPAHDPCGRRQIERFEFSTDDLIILLRPKREPFAHEVEVAFLRPHPPRRR